MVKYIKSKPLSKRELKDLHREPWLSLLGSPSPVTSVPNSPLLSGISLPTSFSISSSERRTSKRVCSGRTRQTASNRLLPRARKPGGRDRLIIIPNNLSPPRSPALLNEVDSGSESDFTTTINSVKARIRQSANKMREDGRQLHELKMSHMLADVNLDSIPTPPQSYHTSRPRSMYFPPDQKRRTNLLKKRCSTSPSLLSRSSSMSPLLSLSLGDPATGFELVFYPTSDSSSSSNLSTDTPPRTGPLAKIPGFLAKDASDKIVAGNASALGSGEIIITVRSVTEDEMAEYMNAKPGATTTPPGLRIYKSEPDPPAKNKASATEATVTVQQSSKSKSKSKKKKKKNAAACAGSKLPVNDPSASLPASPLLREATALASPLRTAQSRATSPIPNSPAFAARSRADSPKNTGIAGVKGQKGSLSNRPSSLLRTVSRGRTSLCSPEFHAASPSCADAKDYKYATCAPSITSTTNGLRASGSSVLRSYVAGLDTYRKVFNATEAGGLALASSQSGKLADILSHYVTSQGIQDVAAEARRSKQICAITRSGNTGNSNMKSSGTDDAQDLTVGPADAHISKVMSAKFKQLKYERAAVDMGVGGHWHEAGGKDTDIEGEMKGDKRNKLMRKVTAFVQSVTTVFLAPWKVLARAIECSRCV